MPLIVIILILVLLFGGLGGYYGYNRGHYGGIGLGTIVLVLWLMGGFAGVR